MDEDAEARRARALEAMDRVSRAFKGIDVDVDAEISSFRDNPRGQLEDKTRAKVILFKPSGKYYTEEEWLIPDKAITPWDMSRSPDAHSIGGGKVLVVTQEPWGYPHLLSLLDLGNG